MKHRDAHGDTIEERVATAVAAILTPALEGIRDQIATLPVPPPISSAPPPDDRFVAIGEASRVLGIHKTTALRYERDRRLPPRRMMGGRTGWLMSELRALLDNLPRAERVKPVQLVRSSWLSTDDFPATSIC